MLEEGGRGQPKWIAQKRPLAELPGARSRRRAIDLGV